MSNDNNHPRRIVIKKVHGAHDDEHGGQWKIAYADFVTAMMAFFLIMWLLSSTTEAQRAGIANFFTSANAVDMPAGTGMLEGGRSVLTAGEAPRERTDPTSAVEAQPEQDGGVPVQNTEAQTNTGAAALQNPIERQRFEAMKAEVERMMNSMTGELREFAQNISVEITAEGLRLQLTDRDGAPMFNPGAVEPSPRLARILSVVGGVLATLPNEVVLAGHTDAQPSGRPGYSNWELSVDRANNARRALERAGLGANRIFRVEGKAASEPLVAELPNDPSNRRIVITVLRTGVVAAARAAARRNTPTARAQ